MVSARSFLVPFKYSHRVTYMVEFSHAKIRLYALQKRVAKDNSSDDSAVITISTAGIGTVMNAVPGDMRLQSDSGNNDPELIKINGEAYFISSPYTYDDLWDDEEMCFKLQVIQHSDVLYIFSEKYPIKVLKRYGDEDWRLENLELINGPFLEMNSSDVTITASDVSGNITLTSSANLFTQTDVGRLLRLRGYGDNIKIWSAGMVVTQNDVVASDNKYYKALESGTTGSKKPVHDEGARYDGGVNWQYLHDGIGIVKINGFISETSVLAQVITRLPEAVTNGTVYWEMGLLHAGNLYPKSGAFFRNRFAFLVNTPSGPKVCLSMVGDYNNFSDLEHGETTAESAITVPVLNTEFNEGKWLYAGDVLFVGTGAAEFYIDVISASAALANDNVKILQISNVGSKALMPVSVGSHIFFVDRYGLSLRDLSYNYYNDGYDQVDISILGKHLFATRIVALSYQEVPDKILWCLTGDGKVVALTFSVEQEVAALSRHDFHGEVEHLAVVPDFAACQDRLWIEVKRFVHRKMVRSIEFVENGEPLSFPARVHNALTISEQTKLEKEYLLQQARYLDGAVLYIREDQDERTDLYGLEHLEGEKVMIFADGIVCEPQIVINGCIKIKKTDSMVLVGKEIISRYVPQTVYLDNERGSGMGEPQRINQIVLMLYASGGGKVGADETHLCEILYRQTDAKMSKPQELFSGHKKVLFNGITNGRGESAEILIENTSPLPMNILAIVPSIN